MNYSEYLALHTDCVTAMRAYFAEAETTSQMLANCTAGPLSFDQRLGLISQEITEKNAHLIYLGAKRLLHDVALLGYGSPN